MKRRTPILALIFSIVALGMATYSIFVITSLGITPANDKSFGELVEEAIDDYVEEQRQAAQDGQTVKPVDVSLDNDPVKGEEDAPVTIVEFSDYECPFCGKYFNETLTQITENYIDTGKVKYVFRDFPLSFHQNALPAGNAAECVRDQGGDEMYYQYHDVLFQNQTALDIESLKSYAADFEIDQEEFAKCMEDEKFYDEMKKDLADGQTYGVRGTPAFFINGILLSGAQPYSAFEAAIEAELE